MIRVLAILAFLMLTASCHVADSGKYAVVDATIRPLMREYAIAGMAVGVIDGDSTRLFTYGVSSRETGTPVNRNTLFELGSVSKTFTATFAAYAQEQGALQFTDAVEKHWPELRGTAFGDVALLHLAAHTAGGFPLQLPETVQSEAQLQHYFAAWQPHYRAGTQRSYANPSIGMLGRIAARSMGGNFAAQMQERLFPALGMKHSYLHVPAAAMADYAQGYDKTSGAPIRMQQALLADEAYGVKSSIADMAHFVQVQLVPEAVNPAWARAIRQTRRGYFKAGSMTQALIWEYYDYPAPLARLLEGNAPEMAFEPMPVKAISPPETGRRDIWVNKTGSTNGFGAYVAFIPQKRLGIVLLANRNYPIAARIRAAHAILSALAMQKP